jgi:ketosteroid isomerase-like protein
VYRWLVARITRWAVLELVSGGSSLPLRLIAPDVRFTFPGTSSFAADTATSAEMTAWIRRFASLRPKYEITDILVAGPPWNTRIAVRLRDRIGDDYSNEGMQYLHMRWGKMVAEEVFIDTERIVAWEARHPELAVSGTRN